MNVRSFIIINMLIMVKYLTKINKKQFCIFLNKNQYFLKFGSTEQQVQNIAELCHIEFI